MYQDLAKRERWTEEFAIEGARCLSALRGMEYTEVREFTSAPAVLIKAILRAANSEQPVVLQQQQELDSPSWSQESRQCEPIQVSKRLNSVKLQDKLETLKVMVDLPDDLIGVTIEEHNNRVIVQCTICNCEIKMKGAANFSYIERHLLGDRVKPGHYSLHLSRAYRERYEDSEWSDVHIPIRAYTQYKSCIVNRIICLQQDMRHRAESKDIQEAKRKYVEMRGRSLQLQQEKRRKLENDRLQQIREELHVMAVNTATDGTVVGRDNEIIYQEQKISCTVHGRLALKFYIEIGTGRIIAACRACESEGFICYVAGTPASLVEELCTDLESQVTQAYDHQARIIRALLPSSDPPVPAVIAQQEQYGQQHHHHRIAVVAVEDIPSAIGQQQYHHPSSPSVIGQQEQHGQQEQRGQQTADILSRQPLDLPIVPTQLECNEQL